MNCPECQGFSFQEGHFTIAQMFRDRPVVIKNVLADRCAQCGYLLISQDVAAQLERALVNDQRVGAVAAALYDLALPEQEGTNIYATSTLLMAFSQEGTARALVP
jgi:hypothetical protein